MIFPINGIKVRKEAITAIKIKLLTPEIPRPIL